MIKKIISKIFSKKPNPAIEKSLEKKEKHEVKESRKPSHQRLNSNYNEIRRIEKKKLQFKKGETPTAVKERPTENKKDGEEDRLTSKKHPARQANRNGRKGDRRYQGYRERNKSTLLSRERRDRQPEKSESGSDRGNRERSEEQERQKSAPLPTVTPKEQSVFNSEKSFVNFPLSPQLTDALTAHNFIHPSKSQEQSIPIILEKKNLICSSETGSGKTLAFVIPILERFLRQEIDQACILTPTREIAIQINSVITPLADSLGITTGLAIGGMDMLLQKKILREYPQVLIATPGRLVDVSSQGLVWLNYTSVVVMDEVDRMLDMGFEKEISTLFESFPKNAQFLMFTATMNTELEKLSRNYVKEYELITIGETMKTKASIDHLFISLHANDRYRTLKSLLQRKHREKILIFFNSIDETIKIFRQLKKDRFTKLNCLHSRKTQEERNQVMTSFRDGRINHLLTTDVLSRGIDIPNIDAVINYELPRDSEDYIHRIGRTGRADFLGKALSFVNKRDEIKLKKIKKLIKSDQGFNFIGLDEVKYF